MSDSPIIGGGSSSQREPTMQLQIAPEGGDTDPPKTREDELVMMFDDWDKDLEDHYSDWIEEAKEDFRYVAGDQYTKTQKDTLGDNERPDAVFNRIGPVIRAVMGAEIAGRQETKFLPRTNDDTGFNDFLTSGGEYLRDEGEASAEESIMKRDCFICGVGWVNCKLEYDEVEDGKVEWDRLVPWECLADPNARKANYRDAQYIRWRRSYSREKFRQMFPGNVGYYAGDTIGRYNADPRHSYDRNDKKGRSDQVTVDLYQWYEIETIYLVATPQGEEIPMPARVYEKLKDRREEEGGEVPEAQMRRIRKYYWAFRSGPEILNDGLLPQRKFTLKAVTGEYDEDKGTFYGLVRSMKEPQTWANTFFNMILHIVKTNAKGGVMAEKGAVTDIEQFEESWAKSDAVSWLADGAMQHGRIQPKIAPQFPAAIDKLLDRSVEAIRETSGVNEEILGLAGRDQPGVLEAQRKQAAYGILSVYFESFKRYNRHVGELMIDYMRAMKGKMIRVTNKSGQEEWAELLDDHFAVEYDVIVDEAPASPNQKQQVFGVIQAMMPVLTMQPLSADIWGKLLEYSPLPATLVAELREALAQDAEPTPEEMEEAENVRQLTMADAVATIKKKIAESNLTETKSQSEFAELLNLLENPDPKPQSNL